MRSISEISETSFPFEHFSNHIVQCFGWSAKPPHNLRLRRAEWEFPWRGSPLTVNVPTLPGGNRTNSREFVFSLLFLVINNHKRPSPPTLSLTHFLFLLKESPMDENLMFTCFLIPCKWGNTYTALISPSATRGWRVSACRQKAFVLGGMQTSLVLCVSVWVCVLRAQRDHSGGDCIDNKHRPCPPVTARRVVAA